MSLFIYFLSWWTIKKHDLREKLPLRIKEFEEVEDRTHEVLNSLERESSLKNIPYYGAITFFFAIGVSMLILPLKWALLATSILSISDAVATMVGVHIGGLSLPSNRKKTLEGTLSFFVSAYAVSLVFASPFTALLIAVSTSAIETVPHLNDNFSIPVTVGILFFLL
ncbi:MAG: hypothetical protein ABEJ72_08965 [Candidatus Aenigmatarchaeota archaeon]